MGSGRHAYRHLGDARHGTDCADRKEGAHSRTLLLLSRRERQAHDHLPGAVHRRGAARDTGANWCRFTAAVVKNAWGNAAPARFPGRTPKRAPPPPPPPPPPSENLKKMAAKNH